LIGIVLVAIMGKLGLFSLQSIVVGCLEGSALSITLLLAMRWYYCRKSIAVEVEVPEEQ